MFQTLFYHLPQALSGVISGEVILVILWWYRGLRPVRWRFCSRLHPDKKGSSLNASVLTWGFLHGHCGSAETGRCKWTAEPAVESSRAVWIRSRRKFTEKIEGFRWVWKDATRTSSSLGGFPKLAEKNKNIPHPCGLKCKVNSFTQPPSKACIVSPNLF